MRIYIDTTKNALTPQLIHTFRAMEDAGLSQRLTKFAILQSRKVAAEAVLARVNEEIDFLKTPFGNKCSGCGEFLATEEDFAKHYTVPDVQYPSLGHCPNKAR
jgi:hypothetical protein